MFKTILAATDLGPAAARAMEMAAALAVENGAALVLVHVFEVPTYLFPGAALSPVDCLTPLQDQAQRHFGEQLAAVRRRCPGARGVFLVGDPAGGIVDASVEEKADLVIVGTHGRRGVAHMVLGSVAAKVVRSSAVPVLVVPQAREPTP